VMAPGGGELSVLIAHDFYRQAGGEDAVFLAEGELLEQRGVRVVRHTVDNRQIRRSGSIGLALRTVWNNGQYHVVRDLIRRQRIDIVHFHNTFPLLSPAVYWAAHAEGIPVVQTIHNYRLACLNGLLLRNSKPCERCLSSIMPWPGVVFRCYRGSRTASAAVAAKIVVHRALRTWVNRVSRYIAVSEFVKGILARGGIPAEKIVVKPNFVVGNPGHTNLSRKGAIFSGRLSGEKGIETLLHAWQLVGGSVPLTVLGDGPLKDIVADAAHTVPGIRWLGHCSSAVVRNELIGAQFLVVPSLFYEPCPMTVLEGFAAGLPVIASRVGSLPSLVTDGVTGVLVTPGDPTALAQAVRELAADPRRVEEMSRAALGEYQSLYSPSASFDALMQIYESCLNEDK
jgi:glycosyltransferase involved in cell wall biosynthesis